MSFRGSVTTEDASYFEPQLDLSLRSRWQSAYKILRLKPQNDGGMLATPSSLRDTPPIRGEKASKTVFLSVRRGGPLAVERLFKGLKKPTPFRIGFLNIAMTNQLYFLFQLQQLLMSQPQQHFQSQLLLLNQFLFQLYY